MFLPGRTGVTRTAMFIQSALVADADAVGVVPTGMCSGLLHWTETLNIPVLADVKVIAGFAEATTKMIRCKVMFRVAAVATSGGTVYDD